MKGVLNNKIILLGFVIIFSQLFSLKYTVFIILTSTVAGNAGLKVWACSISKKICSFLNNNQQSFILSLESIPTSRIKRLSLRGGNRKFYL